MKTKHIVLLAFTSVCTILFAQQDKVVEATVKVFGNCAECKERIEGALKIDEVKFVKWNKNSKQLKLAYESTITIDSLKQRIASVGHDTEGFTAPDSVYAELPACCLYRESPNTH